MSKKRIKFVFLIGLVILSVLIFIACGQSENTSEIEQSKQQAIAELVSSRAEYPDYLYSPQRINELNTLLEQGKNKISETTKISEIRQIVDKTKGDFSKVLTMDQEAEIRQDEDKKNFAIFKRDRQSELNEYRKMLDDSQYSSAAVEELDSIILSAKNSIFYAETYDDVWQLYDSAVEQLFAVKTIEQENIIQLQLARESAILSLQNYRNAKDDDIYSNDSLIELDSIVGSVSVELSSAATFKEIDRILQQGYILIDSVPISEQNALEKYKANKTDELRLYRFTFDDYKYTSDGINELNQILSDAIDNIQNAEDTDKVREYFDAAKIALETVYTYAELLETYKSEAINRIRSHRESKIDTGYSYEGIIALDTIILNAQQSINDAATFETVSSIESEAINALNNVNVLDEELSKIKNARINDLIAYRSSFDDLDYTQSGILQLDNILSIGCDDISRAATLSDLNAVYDAARQQMNSILTKIQELAQKKIEAVQELNEYRNGFVDERYSAYGVQLLNRYLSEGIIAINASIDFADLQDKLIAAKNNLANVMEYPIELQWRKNQAISEINNTRNNKDNAAFSAHGVALLNAIVDDYTNRIAAVFDIDDIDGLKVAAIEELNSVLVYSQELSREIAQKIKDIESYHADKLQIKYTDDGAVLLELALKDGISSIKSAKTFEQLNAAYVTAVSHLDGVMTYDEELTEAKNSAEESIRLYRDTKLNSSYTQNGIALLDSIVENVVENIRGADNFISVSQMLDNGRYDLDAVPTHEEELVSYKEILVDDLQDYRALKQNVNYSSESVERLNQILNKGITDINSAQTIDQANEAFTRAKVQLDSVPNLNQGLQLLQDNAVEALKAHRSQKNNDDYTNDAVTAMDVALSKGIQSINNAMSENAILDALNKAIADIDGVKSIADILLDSKNSALNSIRSYRNSKNDNEYSNDGINELNNALLNGEIAIDKATTVDAVEDALLYAKNAMDAVLTKAEESNIDIWSIRTAALDELNAFRDNMSDDNYGPKGVQQLNDIMMNAISEIGVASTEISIKQIVQQTKESLRDIKQFGEEYQNEIFVYRDSFSEQDYSLEALERLDAITQSYAATIIDNTNKEAAHQAYLEAIQMMDSVLPSNGDSRNAIKCAAIAEITEYRESKRREDYDDESNMKLDNLLSTAIEQIFTGIGRIEINEIVVKAKTQMNQLMSNDHNSAISWLTQYRELFDDDDYSEENVDLLDSILDDFIENAIRYPSLKNALLEAVRSMDSIETLLGDTRQSVKDDYINELNSYKNTFDLSNYSVKGIELLDSHIDRALCTIQLSKTLDLNVFENSVNEAKSAMNAVFTLKGEADKELTEYRAGFDDANYTEEGVMQLNKVLQDFIDAEFEIAQLPDALNEAKSAMDAVLTLGEEEDKELAEYLEMMKVGQTF